MNTIDPSNACPRCGAPVPPEAPQGLCPRCVLAQAAAPQVAATATANIPSFERLAAAFPQLQILELIGRGGMGFVFKARQPHLDRFVALKLLPDSLAHDPHFAERFNREGRTLARLNHPNIVSIFDFGQAGGFYYLLMEYVDGVNLRQAMQAGRFSPAEALAIVPKICEALQYAHEEGVLHRDIKPENILLDAKGRVKIADFGIAKIVGDEKPDVSLTATGAALGTPHYMAPEQFEKPATVDHRADIYSLGVVFYEMLTGELPIGRFSPPSQRTPVDPRVDDVVMRTLEREREKRFQSAGEMKTNVEHLTEAGAGTFKGVSRKAGVGEAGAHGTIAIDPSTVQPTVPAWSLKAIWGAVLTGISLVPLTAFLIVIAYFAARRGPVVGLMVAAVILSLPAIAGTILGWMALNDIRVARLRGLPLAMFAALAWPLMLLVGGTLVVPSMIAFRPSVSGTPTHFAVVLTLLVPAGVITFAIWVVYATARWGANKTPTPRRGVLKWIFLALLLFGLGAVVLPRMRAVRQVKYVNAPPAVQTDATPWIGFTVTAVELREEKGVRWLAIDYLDDVHGNVTKAFLRENSIPDFNSTTRASEFLGGDTNAPVRHQRIEYRMPSSVSREQLEKFRDNVAKTLNQKSFRLEMDEEKLLFEFIAPEGGSLKASIKVMPSMKGSVDSSVPSNANSRLASAEAWSPKIVPGETPDLMAILAEAKTLTAGGRYEDALQHHLWYHKHALEFDRAQAGVRLSFALSDWMELARRYAKARQALLEIRDGGTQEFARGGGHFGLFMEVSAINKELGEQDATLALFRSIEARDPKLARQCYPVAEDLLLHSGDYRRCASFIPNFQKRFEQIRTVRERTLELADRTPEANQTSLRKEAEQTFIKEARTLTEILVGIGRKAEAETIRDQAVDVLNVPELQSAVADAERKIMSAATTK